jgi:LSD1 subclass zinc finger protein
MVTLVRQIHSWGCRALCAVRGHDMLLRYEPGRLSLRCASCGAETPGWQIDVSPRFRSHRSAVLARPRIRHDSQAA